MLGLLLSYLNVNSTIPSHFVLKIAKVKFITLSIYSNPFQEWQFTLVCNYTLLQIVSVNRLWKRINVLHQMSIGHLMQKHLPVI
jgi:hypothetical protein